MEEALPGACLFLALREETEQITITHDHEPCRYASMNTIPKTFDMVEKYPSVRRSVFIWMILEIQPPNHFGALLFSGIIDLSKV